MKIDRRVMSKGGLFKTITKGDKGYQEPDQVVGHMVELTEHDLYLLGHALSEYTSGDTAQDEHSSQLIQQILEMQADY